MVTIRLSRGGARKKPFYRVVATDSHKRRDSGYIERLGYFNPIARGQQQRLSLDGERIRYWISQGARVTPRVISLMKEQKKSGQPGPNPTDLSDQAVGAD